jgi:hypothetical protein
VHNGRHIPMTQRRKTPTEAVRSLVPKERACARASFERGVVQGVRRFDLKGSAISKARNEWRN